jgi:monovalent cation:H+ antiporter-2, CPA2 family
VYRLAIAVTAVTLLVSPAWMFIMRRLEGEARFGIAEFRAALTELYADRRADMGRGRDAAEDIWLWLRMRLRAMRRARRRQRLRRAGDGSASVASSEPLPMEYDPPPAAETWPRHVGDRSGRTPDLLS